MIEIACRVLVLRTVYLQRYIPVSNAFFLLQLAITPLGMQDKRIPDYYLTASSSYASSTGPKYAR